MSWKDVLKADDDIEKFRTGMFGTRNMRDLGRRLTGGTQEEQQQRADARRASAAIKRYFKQSLLPELKDAISEEKTGQKLPILLVFDDNGPARIEGDKIVYPVDLNEADIEQDDMQLFFDMATKLFKKKGFTVDSGIVMNAGKHSLQIKQ